VSVVETSVLIPQSSGIPQGAYFFKGPWKIAWSDKQTVTYSAQCSESIAPPGTPVWNGFAACILTDASNGDVITITASCALSAPTEGNCFGYLKSDIGTFIGRSGTISWHDTLVNDKSVPAGSVVPGSKIIHSGTGQWYE
jgi:hypothetical protein